MRWPWSKPVSVMSERLRCLLIQTITRWRSRRRTMVRAKRSSRFLLLKGFVSDLSAELGTDAKKGDSVSVMLREQLAL
ncbi:hypothetical protein GCM10009691_00010 [Brevibacterium picturae]|uniref:Uncharacterized protein n=1 Tax=Brevibacterium picturae TaxID=260553 RepID=A0ABP4LQR8_9MICO